MQLFKYIPFKKDIFYSAVTSCLPLFEFLALLPWNSIFLEKFRCFAAICLQTVNSANALQGRGKKVNFQSTYKMILLDYNTIMAVDETPQASEVVTTQC